MLLRLVHLYRRYALRHLCQSFGTIPLMPDMSVSLRQGRVCVDAGEAVLDHGGARATGAAPSLPYLAGAEVRVSLRNSATQSVTLPALSRTRVALAHVRLWPGLVPRALRVLPLLPRRRDPHVRREIARRLGLTSAPPAPLLELAPPDRAPCAVATGVTIILPVHNAAVHVMRCLDRVARGTDLPWRLVIVEDGSTDVTLRPFLERWVAAHAQATLICHDQPKGFAAAVNAALEACGPVRTPVVLLNSDVTLPQGWASRLVAPLLADGTVASVTPFSNEGELMGAPHACVGVALRNSEEDAIDAALAPFARHRDLPSLPTGSGFCMALSPHWLAEVPRLDAGFGRGYGEEVDWCQRVRALGGRHVCQTGMFVGHVGAASFGVEQRRILRRRTEPVLAQRWPRYDAQVAQARAADPLAGDRLRAGLIWAGVRLAGSPLPVYLAHTLGGGTARWLAQRLSTHEVAVVLRVGGPLRWQVELHTQAGVTSGATNRFSDVLDLLRVAGPREVIYTCAVGDPAPDDIPFRLLDLCAGGQGLEILFHDYFPLNRDYTFRSAPDPDWQALWRVALDRADHLTVFSDASRAIVSAAHPALAGKIRLRRHGPLGAVPRLSPAPSGRLVIGVPGHLNAQKGSAVVAELARICARSDAARLVVLGEVAPDCPLPRSVRVVGGYRLEDLPHLVARYGIGCWLIPSLWPETFSYVTHEALATGLPSVGFDLGGQGDALRRAAHGHVVALRNGDSANAEALLDALRALPEWPSARGKTGSDTWQTRMMRRARA